MTARRGWMLVVLAAIAGGGLVGLFLRWGQAPASIDRIADLPAVVREIQQLNELVSVKYTVQKVVGLEEQKALLGSEKILLIVQAEVLAGIELSKLTPEKVHLRAERQIQVLLPSPKILHTVVDEKHTKVWDRRITWWTPWVPYNPDLERQARLAALESVNATAVEMGILGDAQRNAEQSIRSLLKTMGAQSVTFEHQ